MVLARVSLPALQKLPTGCSSVQARGVLTRGSRFMKNWLPMKLNKRDSPILKQTLLIGQVLPGLTPYQKASGFDPGVLTRTHDPVDIRVPYYVYDQYLKSFFEHEWDFLSHDVNCICKTGDTVLIRRLEDVPESAESLSLRYLAERKWWIKTPEDEKPKPRAVSHEAMKVIYRLGDVQDPLTKKMVVGEKYRDEMDAEEELYGKSDREFSYEKAPPRGWQEGKRDFTGRRTYNKWHDFKKNDRYGMARSRRTRQPIEAPRTIP